MKMTELKECTRCGVLKHGVDEYYSSGHGQLTYCKACRRDQIELKRSEDLNHSHETMNSYYKDNREKVLATRKYLREHDLGHKLKHMWRNSKQRAAVKGLDFDTCWEDILHLWEKQVGKCAISGELMTLSGGMLSNKISLDRIDSTGGYTNGNLQLVTVKVNYMKRDMPQADFFNLCKKIVENNPCA